MLHPIFSTRLSLEPYRIRMWHITLQIHEYTRQPGGKVIVHIAMINTRTQDKKASTKTLDPSNHEPIEKYPCHRILLLRALCEFCHNG